MSKLWDPLKGSQLDLSVHTYKSRRIIILHCLGIAKGLQNWVGLEQLFFQLTLADK